ncbi:response regulator [Desulfosediminicola sp.]|uniref:response regulator n=1 Tax=Desulfosediminicola sp. TaxID=2886825 RepID=UPI003AF1EBF9
MSSIAIYPCTSIPASDVVKDIAESLDLTLYKDNDLFADTSRRYGTSIDKLEQALYGKTSVFNQFTLEREKLVNQLKSVLGEKLVSKEEFLFSGSISFLISDQISHVLKVLLADTKQSRIDNAIVEGKVSEKEAQKNIRNDDLKVYYLADFLFKKEAYDASLYDLVVPLEGKSREEIVSVVSQYFHKTSVLRTSESQLEAEDLLHECRVNFALLNSGHKVKVFVKDGLVKLKVEKSVLNFTKLVNELKTIVTNQVDAVKEVVVEKSPEYNDSIYRRQKFDLPSKVLFVDDEKEFVQTVSERLISRDVGTYGVFNGEEALNVIAEDRPDVMVLDLKMPGIYGIEVLRRAKEMAPEVEVIILTGHGTHQDMMDCMQLGAFAYMNKPVDIGELSANIKAANEKVMAERMQAVA